MTTVTFSGNNSAQVGPGETVTITVTKPDNTPETLTTTTTDTGTYTISKDYTVPRNYSAKAHQDADAQYSAWDSGPVPFVIPLQPRTGTLTVTLG